MKDLVNFAVTLVVVAGVAAAAYTGWHLAAKHVGGQA